MNLSTKIKNIHALSILLIFYSCGSDDEPAVDCGTSDLEANIGSVDDASCGLENGSFQITISGGSSPFEINVAGAGFQTIQSGTSTIEGVASGNLVLTIRDGQSCTATTNVNIADVNDLALETQLEVAGCESADGTIAITATGGTEPYSYSLDGGTSQSDNMFSNLAVGDYTALVTDDEGCETSVTVSVLSGVSYNDEIIPIINENCAINTCHDGSNDNLPDWTVLANIRDHAENIKTRTQNETMPPDASMDAAKIQAIACWIDDGTLDN